MANGKANLTQYALRNHAPTALVILLSVRAQCGHRRLIQMWQILKWLLDRLKERKTLPLPNRVYVSEILSILLQASD